MRYKPKSIDGSSNPDVAPFEALDERTRTMKRKCKSLPS